MTPQEKQQLEEFKIPLPPIEEQKYGLLQLGGDSFLIQAYPVSMRFNDFVLVFATVVIISVFASLLPANRAAQQGQLLKEA